MTSSRKIWVGQPSSDDLKGDALLSRLGSFTSQLHHILRFQALSGSGRHATSDRLRN